MSLNRIFDIAGSGMAAQSIRLNTTASNIANAESPSSNTNDVYKARKPVFAAIQQSIMNAQNGFDMLPLDGQPESVGVEVKGIVESKAPLEKRYQPDHPMADKDGYVLYPNVNVMEEMADMLSATRSFQTNVEVMDAAKTMMQRVLTLGQ